MVIFDFTDSFTAFMCTTGRQEFLLLTKYLNMYAKLREQHPQDEETLKRRPRKNKQSHGTPFFPCPMALAYHLPLQAQPLRSAKSHCIENKSKIFR